MKVALFFLKDWIVLYWIFPEVSKVFRSLSSCFPTQIVSTRVTWRALSFSLKNRQQFSVVCTLINHRNDFKIFKTQVEPQTAGEYFHCKVLTSLLWSMRVQIMENGCRFAFHNNILLTVFDVHFLWFVSEHRARENEQKTLLLLNIALDQSARKKSLNYWKNRLVRLSSSWSMTLFYMQR